ncbi:solute carrier family 2 member 11, like isoform X2 [Sebastes fasciatus]|uniref:solute carrier family 2 member 11, like isoform X2 n=1 Tax=Sebastes fasciatus TaxID=394691 RepID=UPI003D9DF7E2
MATTRPTRYLTLLLDCPVVIAAICAAGIGGTFQYGFCISVMTSPSAFIKELVNTTCLQRYGVSLEQWQVSLIWSSTVSIFCIGGLLGSLMSSQLLTRFGRKKILLLNNFVAIIGAVLMLLSQTAMSFEMILVGRFLYGINAGVSLPAQVLYLVECAPKCLRGMVVVTVLTFQCLGKFSGQLLGISELLGTRERWPWLLGFNGFTALLQLSTLTFLPESPIYLLLYREDRQACEKALKRLWGNKDHSRVVEEILEEKAALQYTRSHSLMELIQTKELRWQLLTLFIITATLQFSGISSVFFYAFEVFRAAGIQEHLLPYANMGLGLCEMITSVACFMIIENTGRKVLLIGGYMGVAATLGLLTITLYLQSQVSWMPYCSMALIFIFIFFFTGGPCGATGSLGVEILTVAYVAAGTALSCVTNWTVMFLMGMLFPVLAEKLQHFCFLIFLFFCVACGLYVKFNVPETKNRTALEITAEFERMHSKSGGERKNSTEHGIEANRTDDLSEL